MTEQSITTTPAYTKPDPWRVAKLMEQYPLLDYTMCETLLGFTEEQLIQFMSAERKSYETYIKQCDTDGDSDGAGEQ